MSKTVQIREALKQHFDSPVDLEELCQDLGLDMRKMRRATVAEFILDIVTEARRRRKLDAILTWMQDRGIHPPLAVPVTGASSPPPYDPAQLAFFIQEHIRVKLPTFWETEDSLTIMFDDIKDSTVYVAAHGDHQWQKLVQQHDDILHPIINHHKGWVVKGLGDGSLSAFPNAHVGLQAALEIQQTLEQHNRSAPSILELHVRIGLHTGTALINDTDVLGLAVSIASRVCSQAEAGEIFISETTHQQASDLAVNFEPVGAQTLKGVPEPIPLYRTPLPLSSKGRGESSVPLSSLGTGQRWAVLVGVNDYQDSANYGALHVCVNDVAAIRSSLTAGGFDPARIRLLISNADQPLVSGTDQPLTGDDSQPPTRANILATLQSIANATGPDDLLLFYYSGHGDEENDESYLVAHDGRRLVLGDTAVPLSRVREIVEQAPARAKVIVLDACHSGADVGGKGPRRMTAGFIRRVFEQARGLAILASCEQGQLSYEWRDNERSVFTHFLLEALAGKADRDEKGFVTVQDASRHVTDGVKLWASQRNLTQSPTLQYTVSGDIILTSSPHPLLSPSPPLPIPSSPFIVGTPILHPSKFFGRQRQIKRLFNLWKHLPLQNGAVVGPRRSGKTSLLRYLHAITTTPSDQLRPYQRADWLPQPERYRWIFVDFQDPRLGTQQGLLYHLLTSLDLPTSEPCTLDYFMDVVSRQLRTPTIVLLDEIGAAIQHCPELGDVFWEGLRALATSNLVGGNLAFVLAAYEPPDQLAQHCQLSSPFFNIFGYTAYLGPLTEPEARALIASSPIPFPPADTDWILAQSACHPLPLQILCRERLITLEEQTDPTDPTWRADALQQLRPFTYLLDQGDSQ